MKGCPEKAFYLILNILENILLGIIISRWELDAAVQEFDMDHI